MKRIIIYLFCMLLFSNLHIISAQEYKYFDLTFQSNSIVGFSPKNLTDSFYVKEGEKATMGKVIYNANYYDTFIPIFKEIFGSQFFAQYKRISEGREDLLFLRKIHCHLYIGEDFKPYYFGISFPTNRLDEFPLWDEKLYRLCMKSFEVDMRRFILILGDKSLFKGTTFEINMGNLYLYSEGRLRMDDD